MQYVANGRLYISGGNGDRQGTYNLFAVFDMGTWEWTTLSGPAAQEGDVDATGVLSLVAYIVDRLSVSHGSLNQSNTETLS